MTHKINSSDELKRSRIRNVVDEAGNITVQFWRRQRVTQLPNVNVLKSKCNEECSRNISYSKYSRSEKMKNVILN